MTSQWFGLMIGYSGLTAYQAAENTVANNAANVNTKGYSRQYVKREVADAIRTYTTYGMAGAGVVAKSVEQYREQYYDYKYWANEADVGRYETHQSYMTMIESYFNDNDATVKGFNEIYNQDFFNQVQELKKSPNQTSTRASFVGSVQELTEYFNKMSKSLTDSQKLLNSEIKSQVDHINSLASQIASLNEQINVIELTGPTANELRDKRALLIDDLSKIVDVDVTEVDILDESTGGLTGAKSFRVTISNGSSLVNGYDYNPLECRSRDEEEKYNQSDAGGLYDIYWKESGMKFYPMASNLSGSLKALLELRDGNNNEALSGNFVAFGNGGTDRNSVIMDVEYPSGYTLDDVIARLNIPEEGTINVGGVVYKYTDESGNGGSSGWTVEFKENSAGKAVARFTFNNIKYKSSGNVWGNGVYNTPATTDKVFVGRNVDYKGIPYYQNQMNTWLRDFALNFNTAEKYGDSNATRVINGGSNTAKSSTAVTNADYAQDLNGDLMKLSFFQWRDYVSGEKTDLNEFLTSNVSYNVTNGGDFSTAAGGTNGTSVQLSSTDLNSFYKLTAANVVVNDKIITDSSLMSTTKDSDNSAVEESATVVVDEIAKLMVDKSKMNFRGCSSTEFLSCILTDISLNTNNATTFYKNSYNIEGAIERQRSSVSGVDDDEEAMDLVRFQSAYNLNARVIQTMTEIYDRLILQTGV